MVDLSFLEKFTKGDTKKMRRYITLYLDVAPKTFEEMKMNLAAKDFDQLRINAHSLKPQADFMGISPLKELLVEIENAIKNNRLENIEELYASAYSIHSGSQSKLNEILDNI